MGEKLLRSTRSLPPVCAWRPSLRERVSFRGSSYRSASAAGNPDGSTSGWLQRWIAAALRRRSGFPQIAGPLVGGFPWITGPLLFQRDWEHDGFQLVLARQDAPALVEAAIDRRNIAQLVLHAIEDLGWRSGRWSQKNTQK